MAEVTDRHREDARLVCGWFAASFRVRLEPDDLDGAAVLFAEAESRGFRRGLEAACRAVCDECRCGVATTLSDAGWMIHRVDADIAFECDASPVRKLMEEATS